MPLNLKYKNFKFLNSFALDLDLDLKLNKCVDKGKREVAKKNFLKL